MTRPVGILKLGILISGGGRTLQNLIECISSKTLAATVQVVVSSRRSAAGIARAERAGVPVEVVSPKEFEREPFYARITEVFDQAEVDLICMCGYVRFWRIPDHYDGRVMNIHPSLLPKYGGQGYYGQPVHRAVLDAGDALSGCTVHFVDNQYDHGPIILQRGVNVQPNDSTDSLAARVFEQEKIAYPDAIGLFAEGRLQIDHGRVRILPPSH